MTGLLLAGYSRFDETSLNLDNYVSRMSMTPQEKAEFLYGQFPLSGDYELSALAAAQDRVEGGFWVRKNMAIDSIGTLYQIEIHGLIESKRGASGKICTRIVKNFFWRIDFIAVIFER